MHMNNKLIHILQKNIVMSIISFTEKNYVEKKIGVCSNLDRIRSRIRIYIKMKRIRNTGI